MRYQIKKSLFFLLVILSILLLLYRILYDLGEAFYRIAKLQTTLDIRWLFRGDAIISPSIYTVVLFPFTFIVYLIFYRKECSLWPMLLFLCTGAINTFSAPHIDDTALLVLYALITFVEIVWLIVAMIKYPKQEPKTA